MAVKPCFYIPSSPLWEYIGDLSQDLLECSYNEDDIRQLWRAGQLDDTVKRKLAEYPNRLEHYWRGDALYSDMLTAFVILHGGWACEYGSVRGTPEEIDNLTNEEMAIVIAFLDKYNIQVVATMYSARGSQPIKE